MKVKIRGWVYDIKTGKWSGGFKPQPPNGMYILDYLDMVDKAVDKIYEGMTWEEFFKLRLKTG